MNLWPQTAFGYTHRFWTKVKVSNYFIWATVSICFPCKQHHFNVLTLFIFGICIVCIY